MSAVWVILLLSLSANLTHAQPASLSQSTSDCSSSSAEFRSYATFRSLSDVAVSPETVSVRQTKSAGRAVLFSAVLPGLGQIYTKSYWKLPIIWGLGGYYIYGWITNNNRYHDFQDQYRKSLESSTEGDLQTKNLRDFYHNQRDSYAWYFGILYLANLVDAYVTASLYDFDVSDDLSLHIGSEGQVLTLRWRL
jgi:hypothetical protein